MCKSRKPWIYEIEKICIKPDKHYNINHPKTQHYILKNLVTLLSHFLLHIGVIVFTMELEYHYIWQEVFALINKLFYQNQKQNVSSNISTPIQEIDYNLSKKKNYFEDAFMGSHQTYI